MEFLGPPVDFFKIIFGTFLVVFVGFYVVFSAAGALFEVISSLLPCFIIQKRLFEPFFNKTGINASRRAPQAIFCTQQMKRERRR